MQTTISKSIALLAAVAQGVSVGNLALRSVAADEADIDACFESG